MTTTSVARAAWRTARGAIPLDRPVLIGILNASPDSFWEGGRFDDIDDAVRHAARMIEAGADIIDIGGESTRPGASPVTATDEAARVLPIVRAIAQRWPQVPLSIDTVKAEVADHALDEGVWILNDVSALRLDPDMGRIAAATGAGVILMHSRGGIDRMASYELAEYGPDPVGDVIRELSASARRGASAGIRADAIVLDPGLGFAKRTEHSTAVIRGLDRIVQLGYAVLVGPSRKRFLGEIAGGLAPDDRLEGTIAACVAALDRGARLFRVHDVRPVRRALDVAWAIHGGD
ncbi:MAG: dihydropteroate synthase [Gemmatimonadetes bacterium]|nr:dihydropteroate synthase [Gemmatimonadota bacterium]